MREQREIVLKPIGVIHSPFEDKDEAPIQPAFSAGASGTVEVSREYAEGLKDLDGFSHIVLIYFFDRAREPAMVRRPFLDDSEHGVFAMRHPCRPNPIGISVVALKSVNDNLLEVEGVDILDGTPLLDIKPFVPHFRAPGSIRIGWLEGKDLEGTGLKVRRDHER